MSGTDVGTSMSPKYCAVCSEIIVWSEAAQAYFHGSLGFTATIAREVTDTPVLKPLKPVKPAPTSGQAGFTVPRPVRTIVLMNISP